MQLVAKSENPLSSKNARGSLVGGVREQRAEHRENRRKMKLVIENLQFARREVIYDGKRSVIFSNFLWNGFSRWNNWLEVNGSLVNRNFLPSYFHDAYRRDNLEKYSFFNVIFLDSSVPRDLWNFRPFHRPLQGTRYTLRVCIPYVYSIQYVVYSIHTCILRSSGLSTLQCGTHPRTFVNKHETFDPEYFIFHTAFQLRTTPFSTRITNELSLSLSLSGC